MKKRPLMIIDCRLIFNSGIGTYLLNILNRSTYHSKYDILCIINKTIENSFCETEFFLKVNPDVRFFNSLPFTFKEQLEFRTLPSCHVYWTPTWNFPVLYYSYKHLVLTIHDICPLIKGMGYNFIKRTFAYIYIRYSFFAADTIITVSEFSKGEIQKFFPKAIGKIVISSLGSEYVQNNDIVRGEYILYVGNVRPHKNIEDLLKAFSNITNRTLNLVICGAIYDYPQFNDLINKHPKRELIKVTGFVSSEMLHRYYINCFCVVMPSRYEGFGLPILEAMRYLKPIISSNAASLPEIGGNCINYFTPGNYEELAEKINDLDTAYYVDVMCYEKRLDFYSWTKCANTHDNIFLSLNNGD